MKNEQHKAVVREGAESTKVHIVYDGSTRATENPPSLLLLSIIA